MKDSDAPGRYPKRKFISSASTAVPYGAPTWKERSGQIVEVLRELDETARERGVSPIFVIRFADGIEAHAFDDELAMP